MYKRITLISIKLYWKQNGLKSKYYSMFGWRWEEKNESFKAGKSWRRVLWLWSTWSLALLHFHFWWSQEGPIFLFFLPLCICLEVSPAVHPTISTFLRERTKEVWREETRTYPAIIPHSCTPAYVSLQSSSRTDCSKVLLTPGVVHTCNPHLWGWGQKTAVSSRPA